MCDLPSAQGLSEECCDKKMKRQRGMHSMTELVVKRSSAIAVILRIDGLSLTGIVQQADRELRRPAQLRSSPRLLRLVRCVHAGRESLGGTKKI